MMQNLTIVKLSLHVHKDFRPPKADTRSLLTSQLVRHDILRRFVDALNGSRSIKNLQIDLRVMKSRSAEAIDPDILALLAPFEQLRSSANLIIHIIREDFSHLPDFNHEQSIYLKALQKHRETLAPQVGPTLISEWICLRIRLFRSFSFLGRGSPDPNMTNLEFRAGGGWSFDDNINDNLKMVVHKAWKAHDSGDVPAFIAAKVELRDIWKGYSDRISSELDCRHVALAD